MSALKRIGCWMVLPALALGGCTEDTSKLQPTPNAEDGGGRGGSDASADPADAGAQSSPDAGQGLTDGGDSLELDAGDVDGGETPSVRACLEAAQGKDSMTEALALVAKDGTQIAIVRYVDPDAFGTSGTTVWLAERFGYARGATSACVTEQAKLDYQISHHNFDDLMTAEDSGLTLTFHQTRVDYDKPMFWSAEAKQGSSNVWGPLDLTLVSCQNLTTQEDCKDRYQ